MEKGLRVRATFYSFNLTQIKYLSFFSKECCRSIRIGKILIPSTDDETRKTSVVYAKFPNDINKRKILLMYPIISKY